MSLQCNIIDIIGKHKIGAMNSMQHWSWHNCKRNRQTQIEAMNSMWHQSQLICKSNKQTLNRSNEFNLTSISAQLQE